MRDLMEKFVKLLLIIIFSTAAVMAQAEKIYRWQDESGTWQFSQIPPAGMNAEVIKIRSSSGKPKPQESETVAIKKSVDSQAPAKTNSRSEEIRKENEAIRTANCANARKNLQSLNSTGRFRYTHEKTGEVVNMSDEEKQQWLSKSKVEIAKYCN